MSAISAIPSPLRSISQHAIDQYIERVTDQNIKRYAARLALWRMHMSGHDVTPWEYERYVRKPIDGEATWRISDTCYGRYVLLIKRGVLVTLWELI